MAAVQKGSNPKSMADHLGLAVIVPLSGEREHLFHKVWGLTVFTILPMGPKKKKT
jgi:hypothetical protein